MDKFVRAITYIVAVSLIFMVMGIIATYMLPKVDIQMPDLGEAIPEKLYDLSPVNPVSVGDKLTDTIIYSLDSSTIEKWVFFDFSRGSVVEDVENFKDPVGWDIAFRRAKMAVNGGGTNKNGNVAIAKLDTTDFDSVLSAPEDAKFVTDAKISPGADPKNINLDKWYSYNFMDHYLRPKKNVYIVKTAEGNYAKMQIINYYCFKDGEKLTGCYTLKYVYQGNGGNRFAKNVAEPTSQQLKKPGL